MRKVYRWVRTKRVKMTPFYELKPGANYLRFIGLPWQYRAHSDLVIKGDPSYGQRVMCLADMGDFVAEDRSNGCFLCRDNSSGSRWILPLIKDDQVFLIDIGYGVFSQLRFLARHMFWNDPTNYLIDIDFEFNYETMKTITRVTPCIIKPLSDEEMKLKTNFDEKILSQLTEPPNQAYRDKLQDKGYHNPVKDVC